MMNRLRCPWAQICQRARAKPSQPRKAMIPGTSGRFNLDHSDRGLCRRDLSSSDVDVSCNRKPPPWLSQREGEILGQARAAYAERPLTPVSGCDGYHSARARMTPSRKDVVAAVPKAGRRRRPPPCPSPPRPGPGMGRSARPGRRQPETGARLAAGCPPAACSPPPRSRWPSRCSSSPTCGCPGPTRRIRDESNDLLMAWDMLHGNVLLHGWYLSDVSFITRPSCPSTPCWCGCSGCTPTPRTSRRR